MAEVSSGLQVEETIKEDSFTVGDVGGDSSAVLEALRVRLLDLTLMNRVLNFKLKAARVVRVIDELPDQLFGRLRQRAELELLPVEEPPVRHALHAKSKAGKKERRATAEVYAKELGLSTSYDLPESLASKKHSSEKHEDDAIQTVLFPGDLEADLSALHREARTAIEEKGSNVLYLVFGFLEWYEHETSEKPIYSPLVMLPVSLRRGDPNRKTGAYRFFISYTDEDTLSNISLQEKLRRDFHLTLPEINEEETPEQYVDRLTAEMALFPRWKVRRQVALGVLSFTKLFMYRDLDPKAWPNNAGPAQHPLVLDLFAGGASGDEYAGEYDFEAPTARGGPAHVPPIIMDADSSQHSAIVDAMQGRTLVIEGPPGTGKSQTIANLIAAALAVGKSVLFVADKLTALQVVSRRLDEHGLGLFCLELHSDKTQKARMMDDIRKRLDARGTLRPPAKLYERLELLHSVRADLNAYAQKMNTRFGAMEWTIHEILWGTQRRRSQLGADAEAWREVILPDAAKLTALHWDRLTSAAQTFAKLIADVRPTGSSLEQHPFFGIWPRDPRPDAAENILRALEGLVLASSRAVDAVSAASIRLGNAVPVDALGLSAWAARVHHLMECARAAVLPAAAHLTSQEARESVLEWCRGVEQYRAQASRLDAQLPDRSTHVALLESSAALNELAPETPLATLVAVPATVRELEAAVTSSLRSLAQLGDWLDEPQLPRTLQASAMASELFSTIASFPLETLAFRPPLSDEVTMVLEAAAQRGAELLRERAALTEQFQLDLVPDDLSVLEAHAATLAAAGFFSFLSGACRAAKRQYVVLARQQGAATNAQMADALKALATYQRKARAFAEDSELRRVLGSAFRGLETNFEAVHAARQWQDRVSAIARRYRSISPRLREVAGVPIDELRLLADIAQDASPYLSTLDARAKALLALLRRPSDPAKPLDALNDELETIVSVTAPIAQLATQSGVAGHGTVGTLQALRSDVELVQTLQRDLATAMLPREAFGPSFSFPNVPLEIVRQSIAFASELWSDATPEPVRRALLEHSSADELERLHGLLMTVRAAIHAMACAEQAFFNVGSVTELHWYGQNNERSPRFVHERASRAVAQRDALSPWLAYLRGRLALWTAGGDPIRALVEARPDVDPSKLGLAAELVVYASLAKQIFDEHPDLRRHEGVAHTSLREKFRDYDTEIMCLQREQLASQIDARPVPAGQKGASVKQRTELALLVHELGKQKAHIPIRQLVNRAGDALRGLKPCFMMSPRSVAQYLEAGRHSFDLVIMDEASQLRPEDAIGAIARGKQAVIVGDSKQLPPTSFFAGSGADEDAEEEFIIETKESILDLAKTAFKPVRQLRWHYRSRHESLIAFSNHRYYDGNLVVFPSPSEGAADLGVRYVEVPDGVCVGGINEVEARRISEAVIEHLRTRPDESFGVVAMNVKQKERIQAFLDERLKDQPELRKKFEADSGGGESAFVKNLESVQGDERDVIFISVTYGPKTPGGPVARTFGPLNGSSGWRRLNVLFTRAKRRVVVFSSFGPEALGNEETLSRGALDLKRYLSFARAGRYVTAETTDREPDSDFEVEVADVLRDAGYPVVPQVGVAGYFIDLAVKHPTRTTEFILGVECDGAAYHSSFSARDRDRLRQQVLEGLGWKIHRIWSTDWFRDPAGQRKRLVEHLRSLS